MKKVLFLMGAFLTISTASIAQTPVGQGNFIIDPYIGVGQSNMLRSEPSTAWNGSPVLDWKLNGGQLAYGGRVEYMLADAFGIGVDFNFVKSGSHYSYAGTDTLGVATTYTWDYTAKKIRAMLRMNYHFVQNDRVDAYGAIGVGYKHASRIWTISDPSDNTDLEIETLIPMSFRIAVGTRIYFTDNIGMMIELGLGGGTPIQFGVSAKF
ncbi:MAG: outer membrane beta-barrel protein [Crocinitomicaceae bacterium]|nr:outer membrane beta-barrel protein [Crocinitomicaceae bacterium]